MREGVMFTIRGCLDHPFLVFIVCGMIYIWRAFPLMFWLLVPAAPVVVCTAVLLGTLLYYGQQSIRETTEIEMKTKYEGIDANNAEKCVESNLVGRRLGVDGSIKGICVSSEVEGLDDLHRVHEKEEERGIGDGEVMADHYAIISKVIGELLESESEHEKSDGDSGDSEMGNHESSHSGSEGTQSSIEGIMPTMLDELHPLLDEDAPHPPASSEAALNEHSASSTTSSIESADDTDVQESEVDDDDHTKSVITWTEEDQNNLMEVGNSEIERNRRLERIIRRRRNRSMVGEINLSDLIAPISTARRNPFDLPQDSGPDSAPSVLSRRRTNPFELADDLIEEDEKERELRRHPLLRRRDNFSARPSIFSPNRLEGLPVKIKPFFVADESSYSPFKRQSSSGPEETESVEYLEDDEDSADRLEVEPDGDGMQVTDTT
ncbi:RNA polymerase-associated protein LEO1-like [Salvia divinorum]|uniref:RNA polymerase-associated protein LEO1-like n=1 Tax=Salvia divinorum TaxID=28513 RepID=A0ABD1HDV6_SALDI